jgi:Bacterial mobilisation protein (MobC)
VSTKQTGSTTEEIILLQPKRVNNITLRLTDDELDTIEEQARKLNLNRSDYLRHQALKSVRRFKPKPLKSLDTLQYRELALIRKELNCQGNNLNQIARALNTLLKLGVPVVGVPTGGNLDIARLEQIASESYRATRSILSLQKKHNN